MNTSKQKHTHWFRFLPRNRTGWITLILIVFVAFSFGWLLSPTEYAAPDESAAAPSASEAAPTLWTCSMHPQIKLPKPGKCPICFMDLIPLESGGDQEVEARQLRMSEAAKKLAHIQVTPVIRSFAQAEIRLVGTLEYDETKVAYLTAWVPGRLDSLFVDYTGADVRKGDPIVSVYSPELLSAQEELVQAKKAAEDLRTNPLLAETANITLEATRKKLELYGLSEEQIRKIETAGTVSDHLTIYSPITGVVVEKHAKEGMYVNTGSRLYTIADLSEVWVLFEAYESDLPWLKEGQTVEFTSLSFPGETFSGTVSFISPVFDKKTRTVEVRVVAKNPTGKLKPGIFVSGVVKAYLDKNGNVLDRLPTERTVTKWTCPMHPEILEENPGDCPLCGMPLVPTETTEYATAEAPLLIPASAPLITGKRAVVYVQLPDTGEVLFEGREVVLGPKAGDYYLVTSGLAEGELVVTKGAFKLDSELQIQAKPSMMSPEGGQAPANHQHGQAPTDTPSESMTMPPKKEAKAKTDAAEEAVSQQALEALTPLYESYFVIQKALSAEELAAAKKGYEKLGEVVSGIDMTLFSGDAHMKWMELSEEIASAARSGASATNLDEAREAFYALSQATIGLHDAFGHTGGATYYLITCPHARDNQGARWLQDVDTMYNSFLGGVMPSCPEPKVTLPSKEGK